MEEARRRISQLRDDYLRCYRAALYEKRASGLVAMPEVLLRLPGPRTTLWSGLMRVDLVLGTGTRAQLIEVNQADPRFEGPLEASLGHAGVTIQSMDWNAVKVDAATPPKTLDWLDGWIGRWLDPECVRESVEPVPDLGGFVHAVRIEQRSDRPFSVELDLGSAPVSAFWELLERARDDGVGSLSITSAFPTTEESPDRLSLSARDELEYSLVTMGSGHVELRRVPRGEG